jgi:hypothetical protein
LGALPEIPGVAKAVGGKAKDVVHAVVSPKSFALKQLFKMLEEGKTPVPTGSGTPTSTLKKQLMKYGGPTDPGFSPPSGPAKVQIKSETPVPWEPKKINYQKAPGTGQPSGASALPLQVKKAAAKAQGMSLEEWLKQEKLRKIKGTK